ncbi:MAG TPA: hypothetical protein PKI03_27045 [Pseudomonadota bacterium]|nr:hypothetical protein [Pseudomonadota bacterium]
MSRPASSRRCPRRSPPGRARPAQSRFPAWVLLSLGLLGLGLLPPTRVAAAAEPPATPPAPTTPAAAPTPAADAPAASPPRIVNANAELARARQLFQERKFSEAADALQRAYAFEPNPLFLFNAGQAYRKAEQRKEALEMYQRYLEVDEKGPLAAEARGYVTDLQAFIKAQEHLQNAQVELETKESQAKKAEEALNAEKQRALFMEQALQKEKNKPFYKKNWFYAVAGIGGFLVVGGLISVIAIPLRLEAEASVRPSFQQ